MIDWLCAFYTAVFFLLMSVWFAVYIWAYRHKTVWRMAVFCSPALFMLVYLVYVAVCETVKSW